MNWEDCKITGYEDSIASLPDKIENKAAWLKAKFDGRTDKEVKQKHNALIEQIKSLDEDTYSKAETRQKIDEKMKKIGAGDMAKSEYGGSEDGVVKKADNADVAQNIIRRNLLDNWFFGQPVNQRGKVSATGGEYNVDRWMTVGTLTGLNENGFMAIQNSPSAWISQRNNEIDLSYKTVTISALVKADAGQEIHFNLDDFDITKVHTTASGVGTGKPEIISSTVTLGEVKKGFSALMYSAASGNVDVYAFKAELGSFQTLAHQENGRWVLNEVPDYGEEVRKCQRYYWRSTGLYPAIPLSGVPLGLYCSICFPTRMVRAPKITLYNYNWEKDKIETLWDGVPIKGTATANAVGTTEESLSIINLSEANDTKTVYKTRIEASAEL